MEYYLDTNNKLYYRINQHFHWTRFHKKDIQAMMLQERDVALKNLEMMVCNQMNSPNAHIFQIMEWQSEMVRGINKWHNGWNISDYTCYLFMRITSTM